MCYIISVSVYTDVLSVVSQMKFWKKTKRRIKKIRTFKRNGILFQQMLRYFWGMPPVNKCIYHWAKLFWRIDETKIVFATFSHTFNCNPGSIAAELAKRDYPGKLVFLVEKQHLAELQKSDSAEKIDFVNVWSWRALKEAATAKIRLENAQTFLWQSFTPKRPEQIYINTWHGSLGIKRLDTALAVDAKLRKRVPLSKKYTDFCISNSEFEDMVMETSFFGGVTKVRLGHARNDIFFQSPEIINEVKKKYRRLLELPDDCRIALYAPTFRENGFFKGFLDIDYQALADALQRKFGGMWKILVKFHPHDVKRMHNAGLQLPLAVVDAAKCNNINELLLATDVGITDYSSWIFDYIHLRRPGFIYAPDLDEYKRGFYYPLTDTPFPVTIDAEQFREAVLNFDEEKYAAGVEAFLEKMGCTDDGKSGGRIADFLETLISGKQTTNFEGTI